MRIRGARYRVVLWELWLPLVLLTIWYVASSDSKSVFYPAFPKIVDTFKELWLGQGFIDVVLPSLKSLALGTAVAIALGVGIGVLIGMSRFAGEVAAPFIDFARSVPAIALLPVLVVLLGTDMTQRVVAIAFGAIWPILLNTIDGIRSIDPSIRLTARSYRVKRSLVITKILIPGALPQITAGVRTGLSVGVIMMVGSEMFGSVEGLGHFVIVSQQTFATTDLWAGILMLGVVGYVVNLGYLVVERRLLRWQPTKTD